MITITSETIDLFLNLYERGLTESEQVSMTFTPMTKESATSYDVTPNPIFERYARITLPASLATDLSDGQYVLSITKDSTEYFSEVCQIQLGTAVTAYSNTITQTYSSNGTI